MKIAIKYDNTLQKKCKMAKKKKHVNNTAATQGSKELLRKTGILLYF